MRLFVSQNGLHDFQNVVRMDMGKNHPVNMDFLKISTNRPGCNFVQPGAFKSKTSVNETNFSALADQHTAGADTVLFSQLNNKIFTADQINGQVFFLNSNYLHGSTPFNCRR